MGATEYECGGQFASLKRLRAHSRIAALRGLRRAKVLGPETFDFSVALPSGGTRIVYLVGIDLAAAAPLFQEWVDAGCRTQEPSWFLAALAADGSAYAMEQAGATVGWWDFTGDVLWALTPENRDSILTALQPKLAL